MPRLTIQEARWDLLIYLHTTPEPLIRFLERDEYRFRTGYVKEYIWHMLKRMPLTERQQEQLRKVALMYLRKRMQREFWYMCRFIAGIADAGFRSQVRRLMNSKDADVSRRASFLDAYLESPVKGEQLRQQFHYECLRKRWQRSV